MRELRNMSGDDERTTTVNRLKLIEQLKANREKHIHEYEEAKAGYLEAARAQDRRTTSEG